jgi:Tol biopolymer transport system component
MNPLLSPADKKNEAEEQLAEEVAKNGWIVFCARSEKGDWDLFFCRPDGSNPQNLTSTPAWNEAAPQFSRDGRNLLYRRIRRDEKIDGNYYGAQGELVFARGNGTEPQVFGSKGEYPWASWSPDGKQIACLTPQGILFIDIETKQVMQRLERIGFFQQLIWSPDGLRFCGVANNFGASWSVACMEISTGETNAVSRVDCCTPDWFPDSKNLIFSNRPPGQKGNNGYGWTQLWRADIEGKERQLVYGEDGRHVYGGQVSPDGRYVVFTGNMKEDGDPENSGAPMGLMRLADAPLIGDESQELRALYPNAGHGPVLVLPNGWEPCWTFAEIVANEPTETTQSSPTNTSDSLARELHDKGWIAYSAETERGDWDLFLMRPDGSDRRNITNSPDWNEGGVRFSRDGKKMLFYRMSQDTPLDNNTYGLFTLILANADGSDANVYGDVFPWAAWGPHSDQFACLDKIGMQIIDLESKKIIRTLPRKGMVQQLGWSPDGKWFCGTANGLGKYWNIGRMNALTGEMNAVSELERYNCTPDWFNDAERIIYSRGIVPEKGGWAELWMVNGDGRERRLIYAEERRNMYGGALSPLDRYVVFTRSEEDLGAVKNSRTRIAIVRLEDTPMIGDHSETLRKQHPTAPNGPMLDLGWGWEPAWTEADLHNPEKE